MLLKFGRGVTKKRRLILVIAVLLLIPSLMGYIATRVNYDVLSYLPDSIETMQGQQILQEDFGKGGFSMVVVEGMEKKDVAKMKARFEKIDHVNSVIWYDSIVDVSVPYDALPDNIIESFNSGDCTLMAVFFDTGTSDEASLKAVSEMRHIGDKQCFISGTTAFVQDLKELAEKEEPVYVALAVILACIFLAIFMNSWLIPVIFMVGIGLAIMYNLGSNIFMGEISYITKALSAVLQLGVTMDYSIFLWHSFCEEKEKCDGDNDEAMAQAVANTLASVAGSSITTIAGFLALCFMTFTLGMDLGIVMAKGVLLGVIASVTVLPSLILVFEKAIEKTKHREVLPKFGRLSDFVVKHHRVFAILFIVLLIPSFIGYQKAEVYYKLSDSVPQDLPFAVADKKLQDEFEMNSTHILLADANLEKKDVSAMMDEIEKVPGVNMTLGLESVLGPAIPDDIVPSGVESTLKSDRYQMILINSEYMIASDEVNNQIDTINSIVDKYDSKGMLIGEAPCTKDLIDITDRDFKVVSIISILAVFVIICFVLKSISLPVILVAVIELAIFINLGLPYYTGTVLPFIASICISTIQLGATVDYAILMTVRYKRERAWGNEKAKAISNAHSFAMSSVMVSALCFFAATFGVGVYSDIDIISSLCSLMARGAIISLLVVMFILPAMFMIFDRFICRPKKLRKTGEKETMKKTNKKVTAMILAGLMVVTMGAGTVTADAATSVAPEKEESVYLVTDSTGAQQEIIVTEHLTNSKNADELKDVTKLKDIENTAGDEKFTQDGDNITWKAAGNDIYYQGSTDKKPPVEMSIKYYLNGEEIKGEDLDGKSGNVKIRIKYKNSSDVPFVAMSAMVVEDKYFRNVKISSGKVIDDGEKEFIVAVAMPGIENTAGGIADAAGIGSTVEVTGKANKFSVSDMMTMVTGDLLDDVDAGDMANMDFDSQINAMDKAAKELCSGTAQLYDGLSTLQGKSGDLKDGVDSAAKGSAQLAAGTESLMKQVNKKLIPAAKQLAAGSKGVYDGAKQVSQGISAAKNGADQVKGGADQVKAGADQLNSGLTQLNNAVNDTSSNKELVELLGQLKAAGYVTEEQYNQVIGSLSAQQEALRDNVGKLQAGAAQLQTGATQLQAGASQVSGGLEQLQGAVGSTDSTDTTTLVGGAAAVAGGNSALVGSLQGTGTDAATLAGGTAALNEGAKTLAKGMEQMDEGSVQLIKGVDALDTGAYKLNRGMNQFYKEAIKKIVDLYNGDLKGLTSGLKNLMNSGKDYTIFTEKADSTDSSVKFIYKTTIIPEE